jgi:nicotinamidase-related amidase
MVLLHPRRYLAAFVLLLGFAGPIPAQTIIDEWPSIKAPPAPELKTVKVDPKTTALLLLDFVTQSCNEKLRPRCLATVPAAKKLLTEARANKVLIVYSSGARAGEQWSIGDTLPDVAPIGKEPYVQSGPNKFLGTDLEKILKDHGITTIIVTGTTASGAVLHTADEAVFRGFKVVVPVDTISAENTFMEQYVAYHFTTAPRVGLATTLTSAGKISF